MQKPLTKQTEDRMYQTGTDLLNYLNDSTYILINLL